MELHQLRYLRAIVRTGSVTAAAAAEHVAQPSVSKQVALLERELGVPLLHRVGRRVVPTDAGRALAECADRMLGDLAATMAATAGAGSATPQRLAVCVTETVSEHLLPAAILRVREQFPGATVSAEMLGSDDAATRLLADTADLAIVALPLDDARLEVHELFSEEVFLVAPASSAWAAHRRVELDGVLASGDLLHSMPGVGLRSLVERTARERGVELCPPSLELRSQRSLVALAALGGGIAFVPSIARPVERGLRAVRTDPAMRRTMGWARRKGRHLGPAAHALIAAVATEAATRGATLATIP
jgi:DNA-binding transcriptional LysR family regulator